MRLLQVIPRKQADNLYGLLLAKERRSRGRGTFRKSGRRQHGYARWSHTKYKGWIWIERGMAGVVNVKLQSKAEGNEEWKLLHAFLGLLDRELGGKIQGINIQFQNA